MNESQFMPNGKADESGKTDITCSRGMAGWLVTNDVSIAFTSYQTGQLFLVGAQQGGVLSVNQVGFQRAMGLWANQQRIYLAAVAQIWRLENMLKNGERANTHFDRCYVPRNAQTTGDLDVHELMVQSNGRLIFVNTSYSCLAELDMVHSFRPLWKPTFISKLAPEDRCHLNGMAIQNDKPRYVTAVCRSDVVNGWRDRRAEGGVLIDVGDNRVVSEKLSMPHSPRLWQDTLWVLNSGTGHLCRVDTESGVLEEIAFLPGFLRGLAFYSNAAIVGLSLPRDKSFAGLDLDRNLHKKDADPWCGIQVIDLRNGDVLQWIRLEGMVRELFDVAVIPNVRCPMAIGLHTQELSATVTRTEAYGSLDHV
jgi:uncharacterized protein (TIGR03032 family)